MSVAPRTKGSVFSGAQGRRGDPWGRQTGFPKKGKSSCPPLCNPMDYRVHGILQARILEWVAFMVSRGSSQPRDRTQASHIAGRFITT